MGFVIQKSRKPFVIDALYGDEVMDYARYLERCLQRRGVKFPAARFRLPTQESPRKLFKVARRAHEE